MIKRVVSERFKAVILDGTKTTTIRDRDWPIGRPIMLFHWAAKPYRSKHVDIHEVHVKIRWPIEIEHRSDGQMAFHVGMDQSKAPLWKTEGFSSITEMDDWFRPLVTRGRSSWKVLMRFELAPRRYKAA